MVGKYALIFAAVAMIAVTPGSAMDVQPTINVISLPTDTRGISIAVNNPRNVPLPVTFEVVERKINPDGTEEHTPADNLFAVYPSQAVIPPGKRQAVRVQWTGGAIDKSRSFTLWSTEVPVDLSSGGQSGVQRILKIGASVHVAPASTAPKPVLESATADGDGVKVSIRNDGNRFVYVDSLSLTFGEKTVAGMPLADMAGRTLIPPGAKREFTVKGVSGQPTLKLLSSAL